MTQPTKDEIMELLRLHEMWANMIPDSGKQLKMEYLDLSGMDLSGRNLHWMEVHCAQFDHCRLIKTDLSASFLGGASFIEADFTEGCLVKAQAGESDWTGCILKGANLVKVDLHRAKLCRVDFSGADLFKAFMYGADLREANFSGAEIHNASFDGTDLRGAIGVETVKAEWIWADDGKIEGLDNIREWLFKASRL
ncbi:MAG: pentapeptide repeat-containing protein [Anaerolineae bacterium]|nr:pentapeptide repeat-containing protein [Anaerolineae bacterium]